MQMKNFWFLKGKITKIAANVPKNVRSLKISLGCLDWLLDLHVLKLTPYKILVMNIKKKKQECRRNRREKKKLGEMV